MSETLPLRSAPRRICILRLSALGDVTHTVPVVQSIQAHWPETKITWIIGKLEHRLLKGLEGVEFILFDKKAGIKGLFKLRRELKGRTFDVLLLMQVALRAGIVSRLIKAPIRLGWDRARSRDRHHWFINHSVRAVRFQHQVPGFLEFAHALGVPESRPAWNIPVSDDDRAWAAGQLPDSGPVLMISPCSSHPLRNWHNEYYARVADHAIEQLGMHVVLIGGPGDLEQQAGREISGAMNGKVVNLIGKDTLKQSLALMEKASVLITPDAGPAHIASAIGTKVIGIHAATWSRRSGPFNSLDHCVDRFEEAANKYRGKGPEELRWGTRIEVPGVMDLVDPESVIEKLEQFSESKG
jgi:heptosyltransferase I